MLYKYKQEFAKTLSQVDFLGLSQDKIIQMIQFTPVDIQGDLAFPCFQLSKTLKKAPNLIAEELLKKANNSNLIAVGPYINYIIPIQDLAKETINSILSKKENYGRGEPTDKKVLLEGRQPNTHKAFHIGHIRNALVSESISRILEYAGNMVIKSTYPGDIGAHVAKWIWYYTNFYKGEIPKENVTKRAGELYAQATQKIDENKELYQEQVHDVHIKLEQQDPELTKIWKETRELCLEDFKTIFSELGSERIDKRYFESDVEQDGIDEVKKLLDKGIAKKSQGAVIMDLEEYDLGIFLLLKSNGASLYSTKDIQLAKLKKQDYPDYDVSLYIVGSEQEHHFQQLFKTLEIIGFEYDKLKHVSYGLVELSDGKMSSRHGNVILYEDFRDELLQKAEEMVTERELSKEQKEHVAKAVTFASMKFTMLLQDSEKKIIFNPQKAVSFEGETGPYLQYTHARCSKIVKKGNSDLSDFDISDTNLDLLNTPEDREILVHLAQFSDIVQKSAIEYKPNLVARYILELAKLFNNYYQKHKILTDDSDLSKARLSLVIGVKQVLMNGLELLGIEALDEM